MTATPNDYLAFEMVMKGNTFVDIGATLNVPAIDVARAVGAIVDLMVSNYPGDAKPRRGAVIRGPAHWYSQTWS
jgi:hypothetical protein